MNDVNVPHQWLYIQAWKCWMMPWSMFSSGSGKRSKIILCLCFDSQMMLWYTILDTRSEGDDGERSNDDVYCRNTIIQEYQYHPTQRVLGLYDMMCHTGDPSNAKSKLCDEWLSTKNDWYVFKTTTLLCGHRLMEDTIEDKAKERGRERRRWIRNK
jgi:hypothetical protein